MPLLFNNALEYSIRKAEENKIGVKLNGTRQLLVYGDYVNLLGENISTINKIREALIHASKEVGQEANMERQLSIC
jgi:hypothetical protein